MFTVVPNTKLKFPQKHRSSLWQLAPPGGYHSILKGFPTRSICKGSPSKNTCRRPPEFRQPETTSAGSSVYSELLLDVWAPLPVSSPAWQQRKLILTACLCDPLARDLGWGLQCRWLVNWALHLLALFSLYNGQRNLLTHSWAAETSSTVKNNQLNWFVGFDFQCSTNILGTVVTSSAVFVLI